MLHALNFLICVMYISIWCSHFELFLFRIKRLFQNEKVQGVFYDMPCYVLFHNLVFSCDVTEALPIKLKLHRLIFRIIMLLCICYIIGTYLVKFHLQNTELFYLHGNVFITSKEIETPYSPHL